MATGNGPSSGNNLVKLCDTLPVPFQNSIVCATLHKGQLGSVGAQLTAATEMFPQPTAKSGKLIHKATDLQIQLFIPLSPSSHHQGNPLWLKILSNLRGNSNSTTRFPTSCLFKAQALGPEASKRQRERALRRPPGIFALGSSLSYHQCEILIAVLATIVYEWHAGVRRCEWMRLLSVCLSLA